jgi:hypothetical protein
MDLLAVMGNRGRKGPMVRQAIPVGPPPKLHFLSTSEDFTEEQAEEAVNKVVMDWRVAAVAGVGEEVVAELIFLAR